MQQHQKPHHSQNDRTSDETYLESDYEEEISAGMDDMIVLDTKDMTRTGGSFSASSLPRQEPVVGNAPRFDSFSSTGSHSAPVRPGSGSGTRRYDSAHNLPTGKPSMRRHESARAMPTTTPPKPTPMQMPMPTPMQMPTPTPMQMPKAAPASSSSSFHASTPLGSSMGNASSLEESIAQQKFLLQEMLSQARSMSNHGRASPANAYG